MQSDIWQVNLIFLLNFYLEGWSPSPSPSLYGREINSDIRVSTGSLHLKHYQPNHSRLASHFFKREGISCVVWPVRWYPKAN